MPGGAVSIPIHPTMGTSPGLSMLDGHMQQRPPSSTAPGSVGGGSMVPFGSPNAAHSLISDYNPTSMDPFRNPNPPNKVVPSIGPGGKGGGGGGMMAAPPHDLPGGLPPPDAPSTVKVYSI